MLTIDATVKKSSLEFAAKPALRHKTAAGWQGVSYRELWRQVEGVAFGLHRWGIRSGDRIAIFAPSSPRWVIAYLGILHAGGIVVPVDKELKSGELRHILADCGARLLLTGSDFLETVGDILDDLPHLAKIVLLTGAPVDGEAVMQTLDAFSIEWRSLVTRHLLPADEAVALERLNDALRAQLSALTAACPLPAGDNFINSPTRKLLARVAPEPLSSFVSREACALPPRTPQDTAVILYTSGTTGRSKGAMLSHANICTNIEGAAKKFQIDSSVHMLSFLPINHVYEQVCGILLSLSVGGTVSFAESVKKLSQNLAEVRPNFLLGVPAVFRLLLDRIRKSVDARPLARTLLGFPPTRSLIAGKIRNSIGDNPTFISGGAALDPEVAKGIRELGFPIYQGYGITETSPVIAFESPTAMRLGSVGQPLPGVEVRIVEPNAEGVGEILVHGPNVMQGYYQNPEATAEVLVDGWYHSGDLGRLDADGYLYIHGRKKNLIVTANGRNVYPEEVEIELLKRPFIAEAMVYGFRTAPAVEEVHAMIYPDLQALDDYAAEKGQPRLSEKEVEELIRRQVLEAGRQLADYKRVKKFTLRNEEFPKTTTRKIKRFAVGANIVADAPGKTSLPSD
ncbi:MAG: long-chain fatty acid--CoA ligase [Desulfuromonadales bacterium]